jgi:hypothetical protein
MKKWDIRKLVISTVIFLFGVMAAAPMVSEAATVPETVKITQEAFAKAALKAPYVRLHMPFVAKLDNLGDMNAKGSRVIVRTVDDSSMVATALMKLPIHFDGSKISTTQANYGSTEGAYVSMGSSNLMSGLLNVDGLNPGVASRLNAVLNSPESYGLDSNSLNISLNPKLIEVATVDINNHLSKSQVLAMDMSGISGQLDNSSLKDLLSTAYSTFKGYTDVMSKRAPGESLELHTNLFAASSPEQAKVLTVLQIMAANLAGVDNLVFHNADASSDTITDAQNFLEARQGQNVSSILDDLQKQ